MFDKEPDGDPHGKCVAEITMLRAALRQVAQSHAWLAFGDCRSFGADVALLSPSDADAVARVALGEYCEGPNAKLTGG